MGSYYPYRSSSVGWGGVIRNLAETPKFGRRGQPLIVLGLVLIGWVTFRVAIVNSVLDQRPVVVLCKPLPCRSGSFEATANPPDGQPSPGPAHSSLLAWDRSAMRAADAFRTSEMTAAKGTFADVAPSRLPQTLHGRKTPHVPPKHLAISRTIGPKPEGALAASIPWPPAAEQSEVEVADRVAPLPANQPMPQRKALSSLRIARSFQEASGQRRARWTADGWVLLRPSGGQPALATLPAAYGSSQFGAVIRYDLRPESALRSQVYLRATGAIGAAFRDRQAALGLAIRPFRTIPIAALIEGRLQQESETVRIRPAVAVVSEIAPFRLPLGAIGEAYGQAGYVGGRDTTGFFDAQVTADRTVLKLGSGSELGIGAGIWSGGQRGAARLDIGPRAVLRTVLRTGLGALPMRATLDWRERVAGGASPGSGPVLTLAAGF